MGVTLWELISGQRLFGGAGTDVDMALRVIDCIVPPLRGLRPEIPHALELSVNRALAREPEQRFQRATEMIDALAAVLRQQGEPTDETAIGRSAREAGDLLLEHG